VSSELEGLGGAALPQPGAVPGQFVSNGLQEPPDPPPGWPPLPTSQAVNFTSATPIYLDTSTVLYRVFGGATAEAGRYWSPIAFQSADAFYGGDAVELSWDSGLYLATMVLGPDTAGETLPVWYGPCATQPADDMDGNILPGYYLPGGQEQYWIPDLATVITGPTAWNQDVGQPDPASFSPAPAPAESAMAPGAAPYLEIADLLAQLVVLLGRADTEARALHLSLPHLEAQAIVVNKRREALLENVRRFPDEHAHEAAATIVASLVGLGRHIEAFGQWSHPGHWGAIQMIVENIVGRAHAHVTGGSG
jgi:hypothetical protein